MMGARWEIMSILLILSNFYHKVVALNSAYGKLEAYPTWAPRLKKPVIAWLSYNGHFYQYSRLWLSPLTSGSHM